MLLTLCYCYFEGMNKMVVNHLEKLFVTNDAATIIKELEVHKRSYDTHINFIKFHSLTFSFHLLSIVS